MYAKLTETQLSRTNFATEQKEWLGKHCLDFIDKDSWPPNRPEPPRLQVCWGVLDKFLELKLKSQNVTDLKRALQTILNDLFDETIRKSVLSFCIAYHSWHVSKLKADIWTFD